MTKCKVRFKMFHVPKENMYSPIGYFLFTWPRTRACLNLLYFYVCVCIWPINSWERDSKIAQWWQNYQFLLVNQPIFLDILRFSSCVHIHMHIANTYIHSELSHLYDYFLLSPYRNSLPYEAFMASHVPLILTELRQFCGR